MSNRKQMVSNKDIMKTALRGVAARDNDRSDLAMGIREVASKGNMGMHLRLTPVGLTRIYLVVPT